MTGRSVRAGLLAATGLGVFYAGVLVWASGGAHLADQVGADWPYLVAIVGGFATQVALLVELRHRRAARGDARLTISGLDRPLEVGWELPEGSKR